MAHTVGGKQSARRREVGPRHGCLGPERTAACGKDFTRRLGVGVLGCDVRRVAPAVHRRVSAGAASRCCTRGVQSGPRRAPRLLSLRPSPLCPPPSLSPAPGVPASAGQGPHVAALLQRVRLEAPRAAPASVGLQTAPGSQRHRGRGASCRKPSPSGRRGRRPVLRPSRAQARLALWLPSGPRASRGPSQQPASFSSLSKTQDSGSDSSGRNKSAIEQDLDLGQFFVLRVPISHCDCRAGSTCGSLQLAL